MLCNDSTSSHPTLLLLAAALLVLSIALSFVATLAGIHRRISLLKAQKLAEVHILLRLYLALATGYPGQLPHRSQPAAAGVAGADAVGASFRIVICR